MKTEFKISTTTNFEKDMLAPIYDAQQLNEKQTKQRINELQKYQDELGAFIYGESPKPKRETLRKEFIDIENRINNLKQTKPINEF